MAKQFLKFFILISFYFLASASEENTGFVRSLDREILEKKQTYSHLRFYFQDIVGGSNATSVEIIPPLPKYESTTAFGRVRIIDNALTLEPELNSMLVGRAEGFYASTSQTEEDLFMVMNFALYQGKYNGSAITILGRNVALNETRELPVIGGSGIFRFATGYAQLRTHSFDLKSRDATIEYNLYVSHYY